MSAKRAFIVLSVVAFTASLAWGTGWLQMQIDPKAKRAAQMQAPLLVRVDKAVCRHDGQPNPEIDLSGIGLGASQGSRRVLVDGVPATQYIRWNATGITFKAPGGAPTKWYHEYTIAIDNGSGKVLSNSYKVRFPIDWDGATPGQAAPGTTVVLNVWGPGTSQGSKILRIDHMEMNVVGWTGTAVAGQIRVVIPAIAHGPHKIFIIDHEDKISKDLGFTVL
jgi:hypothetical protein